MRGHGPARRLGAVGDGRLGPADLAGGEEVVGELAGRRAGGLERLARAQVQPRPARGGGGVVERLAHERVPEGEVVDLRRVLDHDARAQGLLERLEQLLPRPPAIAASVASRKSRPSTAAAVSVSTVAGASRERRRETRSLTPSGRPGASSGASARLRSISSMKNGLPAVRSWSVRASVGVADEDGGLRLAEPRERDAPHDLLAAEVGEQPRGRAAGVGLARRAG